MGGSKKGERRGGAKPGHVRKSAAPPSPVQAMKRGPGRPPGAKNRPKDDPKSKHKPQYDPALVKILNKRISVAEREQQLDMYYTIVGKSGRMPKEVMLDAMRYFEDSAVQYSKVLKANLVQAARAETLEEKELLGAAISEAEGLVDKYLSMTVDVAFKVAPFVHPRLAAIMTNEAGDKSTQTLFQMLMRDLDEAGQRPRYIEHDASEVAK